MYLSRTHSFIESVRRHADHHPDHVAFRWLEGNSSAPPELTYAELDRRARVVAQRLVAANLLGQPVLQLCPPGLDYVSSLLGALYAGVIVVPASLPTTARITNRVMAILSDCEAGTALVSDEHRIQLQGRVGLSHLTLISATVPMGEPTPPWTVENRTSNTPCILQYTSGSTSAPRGVVITADNLRSNQESLQAAAGINASDVCVSWLPPHHDMGLMASLLQTMYTGSTTCLMAPEAFMRSPVSWLRAITRYRATIAPGPTFAFELCATRSTTADISRLDLSSVRLAAISAEPVRASVLENFSRTFEPCGFRSSAFFPCYGMAEATLFISAAEPSSAPKILTVDASALGAGQARPVAPETSSGGNTQQLVSCGKPGREYDLDLVDPKRKTRTCDGEVGEIWLRGPSVSAGYLHKSALNAQQFGAQLRGSDNHYFRTGDLGFLYAGELFITGRLKEVLIINAANHYPQDIEQTVQQTDPSLLSGRGAVFAFDIISTPEQFIIVQEIDRNARHRVKELLATILERVTRVHGICPARIVLVRHGNIPTTPSGKIQRLATAAEWKAGTLRVIAEKTYLPSPEVSPLHSREGRRTTGVITRETPRVGSRTPEAISTFLTQQLALRLDIDIERIDPTAPLTSYGVDSLMSAELIEQLETYVGAALPATLTFESPSISDLVLALTGHTDRPKKKPKSNFQDRRRNSDVAIVGVACKLPGAESPEAFFENLLNGVESISTVPDSRWNSTNLYSPQPGIAGKISSNTGGFISGVDLFDAGFFGISEREAAHMDPQQRLMLETVWCALEDASIPPTSLAHSDAGVFAAACNHDYAMSMFDNHDTISADHGTGNAGSVLANRVSYFLNLKGPSQTVDAACASGLVALHQAAQAIRCGECDVAIVGAANTLLSPATSIFFSQARALSRSGTCRPFDSDSDGLVRSDGVVAIVLRRHRSAVAAGNPIRALVASSAVSHNGQTNGLMAPSVQAQERLIDTALERAGLQPDDMDFIEGHGVGTPVSDLVEWTSLERVMAERKGVPPCYLGSCKANIGHTEAASGLAGIVKVVQAFEQATIPPNINFNTRPEAAGPDYGALRVPTVPVPWPYRNGQRIAGISAFGFGGANAHVILRHPAPTAEQPQPRPCDGPELLLLSARTPEALNHLQIHLAAMTPTPALPSVSKTLSEGRSHHRHRLAVIANTQQSLATALQCDPDSRAERIYGEAPPSATATAVTIQFDNFRPNKRQLQALQRALPAIEEALRALGDSVFESILGELTDLHPDDTLGSSSTTAVNLALFRTLTAAGVNPTQIRGTDAGAFSALSASGCCSPSEAAVLSDLWTRVRAGLEPRIERTATPITYQRAMAATHWQPATLALSLPQASRDLNRGQVPCVKSIKALLLADLVEFAAPTTIPTTHNALNLTPTRLLCEAANHPGDDDKQRARNLRAAAMRLLGALYVGGASVTPSALQAATLEAHALPHCRLPSYPFQRKRHWVNAQRTVPGGTEAPASPRRHPILGRARRLA